MGRKFEQSMRYTLTIFDMSLSVEKMNVDKIYYFIGCEEIAPTTGKPHFQSYIELKKKCLSLKELNDIIGVKVDHAEKSRGTAEDNTDYINKLATKPEGFKKIEFGKIGQIKPPKYTKKADSFGDFGVPLDSEGKPIIQKKISIDDLMLNFIEDVKNGVKYNDLIIMHSTYFNKKFLQFNKIYNQFKPLKTYPISDKITLSKPYQVELMGALEDTNDREIIMVVDIDGGAGKTTTSKLIHNETVKNGLISQVVDTSKKSDLALAIREDVDIVNFDLSRSQEDYINFDAIESIKNGSIFSGKYDSQVKILDKQPKVYVNCNSLPADLYDKLSIDRVKIITVKNRGKEFNVYEKLTIDDYEELYNKGLFNRKPLYSSTFEGVGSSSYYDEPEYNNFVFQD